MNTLLQTKIEQWLKRSQHAGIIQPSGETFALGTTPGTTRQENQDRVVYLRFMPSLGHAGIAQLGILCDGMGGMAAGGQCADLASAAFISHILSSTEQPSKKLAEDAALHANRTVYAAFRGKGGSTLSAFIVHDGAINIVNVGDSRAYILNKDNDIHQITTDDTIGGQLLALGKPPESQTPLHNRLVQYIGMGSDIHPHTYRLSLSGTQKAVMLTSDGAHGIPLPIFEGLAQHAKTPKALVERLLSLALWMGGKDNATVLTLSLSPLLSENNFSQSRESIELWGPALNTEIWLDTLPLPRTEIRDHYYQKHRDNTGGRKRHSRSGGQAKSRHQLDTSSSETTNSPTTDPSRPSSIPKHDIPKAASDEVTITIGEKPVTYTHAQTQQDLNLIPQTPTYEPQPVPLSHPNSASADIPQTPHTSTGSASIDHQRQESPSSSETQDADPPSQSSNEEPVPFSD